MTGYPDTRAGALGLLIDKMPDHYAISPRDLETPRAVRRVKGRPGNWLIQIGSHRRLYDGTWFLAFTGDDTEPPALEGPFDNIFNGSEDR